MSPVVLSSTDKFELIYCVRFNSGWYARWSGQLLFYDLTIRTVSGLIRSDDCTLGFYGLFFFTCHVVYSKIIPKSPGLTTSKRKTGFVLTSPWKFLIILINSVLQDEEDCDLYIATCDHHFNVLLSSPSPKSQSPKSQSQDQRDLGWH